MGTLDDLRFLITRKTTPDPIEQLASLYKIQNTKRSFLFNSYTKSGIYLSAALLGALFYILYPSIPRRNTEAKMFSKRPDKYTTGLINMRNDCFANSSIQAYSSLPGLTEYLNKFNSTFRDTLETIESLGIDLDDVITSDDLKVGSHSRFKSTEGVESPTLPKDHFKITLHIALAKIMKKLQDTQLTTRTISVWTFLHELEGIYNAKISRSQHDAHELTQLINETLETENLICMRVLKKMKEVYSSNTAFAETLSKLEFPDFPFNGLTLSQMKCLSCSGVSKPNISPFLMLTLHLPEELSTDLDTLLNENESETIAGYQCLKCRLLKIMLNEKELERQGKVNSPEEQKLLGQLQDLNANENLFINEDLPQDLEEYVKAYNKLGLDISKVSSTVFRKTQILKPPKVFGIHLSRSSFNGVTVTRNPCRVTFSDKLALSIDDEHLEMLQRFQESAMNEEFSSSPSKVLTTDVNDMEDENVQREDIDELGEEEEKSDQDVDNSTASDAELSDLEDTDVGTVYSQETVPPSLATTTTVPGSETVVGAPYTKDQTVRLMQHFQKFKFQDNNDYKYRLKAVIRHQGSHTQGHYECYKRKPLFVKDNDGNFVKLSPEIDEECVTEIEHMENPSGQQKTRTSSSSSSGSNETINRGNFRRKFSLIMGRRPSVAQADPNEANLHEIIDSGLATPAEVMVNGGDYFQLSAQDVKALLNSISESNGSKARVKMRKIPSVIKHPFWRIGDSQVTEVSRSAVLFETTSVYMLYYERMDRKQVKR